MKTAADLDINFRWADPPPVYLFGFRRALVRAWKDKFGGLCSCGREMLFGRSFYPLSDYATIDHIRCRAMGGTDALNNLQVICQRCNQKKSRIEFREYMDAVEAQ